MNFDERIVISTPDRADVLFAASISARSGGLQTDEGLIEEGDSIEVKIYNSAAARDAIDDLTQTTIQIRRAYGDRNFAVRSARVSADRIFLVLQVSG